MKDQENSKLKIIKSDKGRSRLLELSLPHGKLLTPFFMPDATRAVVKNIGMSDLKELNLPALVVNTFHLYLQPGMDLIRQAGGVNKFMDFDRPLLSDSGGFQVYSLIHNNREKKPLGKITDEGAFFKSPLDGSKHELTPEKSIQIQFDLGTDMIVALDDCPSNDSDVKAIRKAVDRTLAWAKRCRIEYDKQVESRKLDELTRPFFFGVAQGGVFKEERKRCTEGLVEIGFDGIGFGARPVDAEGNFLHEILEYSASIIPENYVRFGLGIGMPEDIVRCFLMGWDMFDCVIPTREGRHGKLFQNLDSLDLNDFEHDSPDFLDEKGLLIVKKKLKFYDTLNIGNTKFKNDFSGINEKSRLPELRNYTKAYLHHLFKVADPLATRLASLNNLEFYFDLIEKIRYNVSSPIRK